jgi:UDPglucose--hexose-1-phosphate uridylyltransferase
MISGRWVIIASERSKRPDEFRPAAAPELPENNAEGPLSCPFCEGNEAKTPPEIFALRDAESRPDSPGWRVRVVPNKFPALARGAPPAKLNKGIFPSMEGVGVHEVVIESPDHVKELADLSLESLGDVLFIYRQRIRNIEEELHCRYVQVFKNKGKEAGASLSHPHSQIIATPIIPKRVKEELYGAERSLVRFSECIFCRLVREEEKGDRFILGNESFSAIAPFASRFPFEIALYPRRHSAHFADLKEEEIRPLARIVKSVLLRLKNTLADPPFNFIIHQGPNSNLTQKSWPEMESSYHWHLEIMPVLTRVAGFELGTGFYINPVPPEAASRFLRENQTGSNE